MGNEKGALMVWHKGRLSEKDRRRDVQAETAKSGDIQIRGRNAAVSRGVG